MGKQRIYADGVESVSLTEGMIRMELFDVAPTEQAAKDAGKDHDVFGELIMTPQGFVRAFGAMEDLVNKLVKAGIIQRKPAAPQNGGAAAPAAPVSPNFN